MIIEGVFERFPALRVVMIESGFAWAPSLAWRLDRNWRRIREENPELTRLPSDIMRRNIWFTTQPMEEPERAADLRRICDWIGWDRILFATDYPHWDFDDPKTAFPIRLTEAERRAVFRDNAVALYGLTERVAA
jgi:predicted TIM-barrel fold metal-dependent hydrolase